MGLLTPLLCIAGLALTQAQSISDLCSEKLLVSGVNYFGHPTDCDKFVQCYVDARGRLVGEIQQCAFSTYWSMEYLTCLPAEDVSCKNDKCSGQADGLVRAGEGNCRGYWECKNSESLPKCCPKGQRFDEIHGGCVETAENEEECKDTCFNELKEESNETVVCEKRAIVGDSTVYEEELAGWGWIKRPCPTGTVFDQNMCDCVQETKPVQKAICKPEVYLPFTVDHRDMSGKGHYILNENVAIQEGIADFNGFNSRLLIPRFNNLEHVNTMVIDIVYSSNHSLLQASQALVSNFDCETLPSIFIREDNQTVTFGAGTTQQFITSTDVPQAETDGNKRLRYKLSGGVLSGYVNGQSTAVTAEGYLRNVHCALSVGQSAQTASFYGQIDELTIYLCDPDAKDSQPSAS